MLYSRVADKTSFSFLVEKYCITKLREKRDECATISGLPNLNLQMGFSKFQMGFNLGTISVKMRTAGNNFFPRR
jgi:hypothetical protein